MPTVLSGVDTPDYLVPRIDNLPTSNARFYTSAHITRVTPPESKQVTEERKPQLWARRSTEQHRHDHSITVVAVHPNDKIVVSADETGVMRVWSPAIGQPIREINTKRGRAIKNLSFHPHGTLLTGSDADGTVWVWRWPTLEVVSGPLENRTAPGVGARFHTDSSLLFGPHNGFLEIFDFETSEAEKWIDLDRGSFTLAEFAAYDGGDIMALGGGDGTISLWNTERTTSSMVQAFARHDGPVTSLSIEQMSLRVASGGADGSIWMVDALSGESLQGQMLQHDGAVTGLIFEIQFARLYSAAADGVINIWDINRGDVIERITSEDHRPITSLSLGADGRVLAAGREDGSVQIWADAVASISQPIRPPVPAQILSEARPAIGILLTHEQSWAMQGIALGELLHSVSLAPGEMTQIAVTSHTRSVMQNSVDATSQSEELTQSARSSSRLVESEFAAVSQLSFGATDASSASMTEQAGVGGLAGLFGVSAGGAHTSTTAQQAQFSTGTRNVSDTSNQKVHQRAEDNASLNRQRYAAAVQEVSETDALELKTRAVVNYNHMHALNLQYYEVVQVQRLRTRIVDAHRLLFVPMQPIEFTDRQSTRSVMERFPHEIAAILRELGEEAAATCVDLLFLGAPGTDVFRQHRLDRIWAEATRLETDLETAKAQVKKAAGSARSAADAVLEDRDALRSAKNPGLYERNRMQRRLEIDQREEQRTADAATDARLLVARLTAERNTIVGAKETLEHFIEGAVPSGVERNSLPHPSLKLTTQVLDAVQTRVQETVAQHQLAVNQGLWSRIDPGTWMGLLQGHSFEGQPIAPYLDPNPVAVTGNHVGFRWRHADPDEAEAFHKAHVGSVDSIQSSVSVPTGGVFGEAVLGESNAADKIDITRFWNWSDSLPPIRPAEIEPLTQSEDEPLEAPELPDVPASSINLSPLTFPAVNSGIPAITEVLKNPEVFRDFSGAKTTAALAASAMKLSGDGASSAGQLASKNFTRFLDLQQRIADAVLQGAGAPTSSELDPTMAGAVLNAKSRGRTGPPVGGTPEGGVDSAGEVGDGTLAAPSDDEASTDDRPAIEFVSRDSGNDSGGAGTPSSGTSGTTGDAP